MSAPFSALFSPLRVGSVTLRNRLALMPTTNCYPQGGLASDRSVTFYRARARGGVGLIISEGMPVHLNTARPAQISAFDRRAIPGFQRIARAVHEEGAAIVGLLSHGGRQNILAPFSRVAWAPSPIPDPMYGAMPHEMSTDEIEEVIAGFIEAAANLEEGGFDGVEVHGAQGHLCGQFLSPWSNHRGDRYGGSLEGRMRFMLEILEGIRRRCGRAFVVGVRLCGDEFTDGGLVLEDAQEIARRFAETGQVDYFSVNQGNFNGASFTAHCPDMAFPPMPFVHLAAGIKAEVDLPVITSGRVLEPGQAERLVEEGVTDIVGLCRALLADHEWPKKAREGRVEEIRPCISCNQGCHGMIHLGRPLTCLLNPTVGKEDEWEAWVAQRPAKVKRVVVVGGGPGGMEAARVAAAKGHEVVLFERERELGGQVRLAAGIPSRAEMDGIRRHLVGELERLQVEVRLGSEATVETVLAEGPDAVIVATGAEPVLPAYAEGAWPVVVAVADVVAGKAEVGQRVVVADEDGHYKATAVAEWLADQGKQVEMVVRQGSVGVRIPPVNLPAVKQRLYERGVVIRPDREVVGAAGGRVVVANVLTGQREELEGVDTVVVAAHHRARGELYGRLKGRVAEVYAVGDCVAPRLALDAIHDGHEAAKALEPRAI